MKFIELTQGLRAIVDDEDFEELNKYRWCAAKDGTRFYVIRSKMLSGSRKKTVRMHRIVLNLLDKNICVDHIDGNGLNNQKSNLRICNHAQNGANCRIRIKNKSGYIGVYWNKQLNKWHSQIFVDRKKIHLGFYNCLIKAIKKRDEAAIKHCGEFAKLNFPRI